MKNIVVLNITDEYGNAVIYMKRQRRITPPIYNENRVNEQPTPKLSATRNGAEGSTNDVGEQPSDNRADEEIECSVIQPLCDNEGDTDEYNDIEEEESMIEEIPNGAHDDSTDPLLIKTEIPCVVINNALDADMIDDLATKL